MKKSRLLGALCATALVVLANISHAAVMNPLFGLNIGGTLYDVTFHDVDAVSFNALWDADNTGTIGSGSSVFSNPPTFWGDPTGAMQAAAAIIAALGATDTTIAGSDGFVVPFGSSPSDETALSSFGDVIYYYTDSSPTLLGTDDLKRYTPRVQQTYG